jgi:hypothetical protein
VAGSGNLSVWFGLWFSADEEVASGSPPRAVARAAGGEPSVLAVEAAAVALEAVEDRSVGVL